MSLRTGEVNTALATIPSVDVDESADIAHRPLAPLASSETFSDVSALTHDEPLNQTTPSSPKINKDHPANEESNQRKTQANFNSLEVLFDFPSSRMSSATQLDVDHPIENSHHIRFATTDQIVSVDKV